MATEFNTGSDASLDEAVKSRYEANTDTNAFTDAEKSKLAGLPAGAQANTVDSVNGATGVVVLNADDIDDTSSSRKFATSAQLAKIDGIETGATADQSGAEIVTAIDAELGGSTWQSGGGGGGGTVDFVSDVAPDRILGRVSSGNGNSEELTATQVIALLNLTASDITIADAGAFTSVGNAESALQEIYGILDAHGDIVTQDIASFVRKSEREVIVFDAAGDANATRPTQASDKTVIWFNHGDVLPVNMGSFDIAIGQGFGVANINTQTGAAYTLALSDAGFSIDTDSVAANTVTIPANAAVSFPVGTVISVTQLGAGTTTISGDAGVTVNGVTAGSAVINAQFSGAVIRQTAADTWIVQGDIT